MIRIGITGGIGCGKSEVCRLLEQKGIPIIHADQVAKQMMDRDETIKSRIKMAFGEQAYLPNGTLDRKRIADIVFADQSARKTINSIVHPFVIDFQRKELTKLEQTGNYRFAGVEAALIYEAGAEQHFDVMVVVAAAEQTVIERLMKRDGLSKPEIIRRIRSQMSLAEKIKRADIVIHNDGSLDELNHEVNRLLYWLNNHERSYWNSN